MIRHYANVITAAFREQARAEYAYFGNLWFNLLSKFIYNGVLVIFIDQLFRRIGLLGNYTQNDFLFMFFMSQFGFYFCYYAILATAAKIVDHVRTGNFDFLLLKPVPRRTFTFASSMQPVEFILTAGPTLFILGLFVQWGDLALTPISVILGLLVWVSGFIICNTVLFALIMPAFKTGDATDMLSVFYSISSSSQIPFSKMPLGMKVLSLTLLPQVIIAGATAEVMLGKGDTLFICTLVFSAAIASFLVYQWLWRFALRHYMSASS